MVKSLFARISFTVEESNPLRYCFSVRFLACLSCIRYQTDTRLHRARTPKRSHWTREFQGKLYTLEKQYHSYIAADNRKDQRHLFGTARKEWCHALYSSFVSIFCISFVYLEQKLRRECVFRCYDDRTVRISFFFLSYFKFGRHYDFPAARQVIMLTKPYVCWECCC